LGITISTANPCDTDRKIAFIQCKIKYKFINLLID
jgi:hypothetical protein